MSEPAVLDGTPPDAGEPGVSSSAAAEMTGVSYRRLDLWVSCGYLHPGGGNGTGDPRRWPAAEVEVARRMGRLADAGLPLEWSAAFSRDGWPAGEIAPGVLVVVTAEAAG